MINSLTITQLVENTANEAGLLGEHGNAFFIEADDYCLLFDTGQGLSLRHNIKQMDLPVDAVNSIVISHGHYDHMGGLAEALELTGPVDVYLHPESLKTKFNQSGKNIGAAVSNIEHLHSLSKKIIYTRQATEITSGIFVTGEIPRVHPIEDTGGSFYNDQKMTHTDFLLDDQALYIETRQGIVVLLGCGHSGIINTLEYVSTLSNSRIHAVIGGMHLLNASDERMEFTRKSLHRLAIDYLAPNHCTGINAICYFKHYFSDNIHLSSTGIRHQF